MFQKYILRAARRKLKFVANAKDVNIFTMLREDIDKLLVSRSSELIKARMNAIDAFCDSVGIDIVPDKREATHFDYVAQYKMGDRNMAKLARSADISPENMKENIESTAELIVGADMVDTWLNLKNDDRIDCFDEETQSGDEEEIALMKDDPWDELVYSIPDPPHK